MFPPQKKQSAPQPRPKGPPGGGPGGPPPGADPFGGDPFGGGPPGPGAGIGPGGPPGMPPGLDPFAAATQPGMPKPGQGIDPMQAMLGGLGPMSPPTPPMGPPLGPGGMPVGGSLPPTDGDGDQDMGGSGLLQALQGALSGGAGGDPYGVPPGGPDQGFQGMGTSDPSMGIEQLLQMIALGQMGVGGPGAAPGAGSSGVDVGPFGNMGQMVGY